MTDVLIKCDRFQCVVSPQTHLGVKWMKNNVCTMAGSNIAVIDAEEAQNFEKELDKAGITHRRC